MMVTRIWVAMVVREKLLLGVSVAMAMVLGCFSAMAQSVDGADSSPEKSATASSMDKMPEVTFSNRNKAVMKQFQVEKERVGTLTAPQFIAAHRHSWPVLPKLDLENVTYYSAASDAFFLENRLDRQLSTLGFGVLPGNEEPTDFGKGYSAIYYDIYEADLPVLVTVDSMLHAFHRTFDDLMQNTEESILCRQLQLMLEELLRKLDPNIPAQRDLMVYLAVPYQLLENISTYEYEYGDHEYDPTGNDNDDDEMEPEPLELPEDVWAEAGEHVERIYNEKQEQFDFFGDGVTVDFSIFYPRGHYGETSDLQAYFRAMTWLIHMPLTAFDASSASNRQERMVHVLLNKMSRSRQWKRFTQINQFYTRLIGSDNSPGPQTVLARCQQQGWKECPDDKMAMGKILRQLARRTRSKHGEPTDVFSLKFFPTKFGYTAWVTEQTTQPRLNPASPMTGRTMASPFDVAYALGADRAVDNLTADLQRQDGDALARALVAARNTMKAVKPTRIAQTPYSDWLEALMHASAPLEGNHIPKVMQTAPWADHRMEAVLASWTEMRHDTLLMIESLGGSGCDFPLAYVEPVPKVYRALGSAAVRMQKLYGGLSHSVLGDTNYLFTHFSNVMKRLEAIAAAEIQGQPLSASDLKFINGMMKMEADEYTSERLYNGWYPRLYWTPNYDRNEFSPISGTDEPLVADVFGDTQQGQVLEVATGHPGVLFIVLESNGQQALYAGPVSEFFYFVQEAQDRMNDDDWRQMLQEQPPPRPRFSRTYWMN